MGRYLKGAWPAVDYEDMPIEPAPSGRIATAARRFGDDYPPLRGQWQIRAAGAILVAVTIVYVPWMFGSLNRAAPWLAWPFLAANLLTIFTALLAVFNAWWRSAPPRRPLPRGAEPHVGVIIPTCGEAPSMILRTVLSVLVRDWPEDKLTLVVSDDKGDSELREALESGRSSTTARSPATPPAATAPPRRAT